VSYGESNTTVFWESTTCFVKGNRKVVLPRSEQDFPSFLCRLVSASQNGVVDGLWTLRVELNINRVLISLSRRSWQRRESRSITSSLVIAQEGLPSFSHHLLFLTLFVSTPMNNQKAGTPLLPLTQVFPVSVNNVSLCCCSRFSCYLSQQWTKSKEEEKKKREGNQDRL